MPVNCVTTRDSFLPYLQALLDNRHLTNEAFNIDNVPPPPTFADFYDVVAEPPPNFNDRVYVIFCGNSVGVTTFVTVCQGAMAHAPNSYYLRARSLLHGYSMWRYWLRLLVTTAFERLDLSFDLERIIQVARVALPRASELDAEIPLEFHPAAQPLFAPFDAHVVIEVSDSDSESSDGEVYDESEAEMEEVEEMIEIV
ncbi:hypothetical protein PENSPDRAFT_680653 [Peniophora sp. CONT]|nr:hypothetical protein PENSPDRAFT_680653 [Peniophora sp. CONT]